MLFSTFLVPRLPYFINLVKYGECGYRLLQISLLSTTNLLSTRVLHKGGEIVKMDILWYVYRDFYCPCSSTGQSSSVLRKRLQVRLLPGTQGRFALSFDRAPCRMTWRFLVGAQREYGPLAQLVARFDGIEEVTGSSPVRSTKGGLAEWHCDGFENHWE